MARNAGGENSQGGNGGHISTNGTTRVRAKADSFLVACRCFSFVTSLAALLCIAVNVLSAVQSFKDRSNIFDGIFRCYAVAIAIFVVVAETEWGFVIKFWKVLELAGRGLPQIFVSVMTRAYLNTSSEQESLVLLQNISSYLLLACGLIYVTSGILCIGFLKRARQKKEVSTKQAIRDLQELEKRREELEALLIVERV